MCVLNANVYFLCVRQCLLPAKKHLFKAGFGFLFFPPCIKNYKTNEEIKISIRTSAERWKGQPIGTDVAEVPLSMGSDKTEKCW